MTLQVNTDEARTHRMSLTPAPQVLRFRACVTSGPDAQNEASSEDGRLVIGTAEGANLQLTDTTVSKYHVELQASEDGLVVKDLGSTNGTTLGGHFIRELVARDSVEIGLGHTRVRILLGDERLPVATSSATRFGELVGASPAMRAVFALLEKAAPTLAPVLIMGESGTGKELAAHAVHAHSPRASSRFEVVDCASLSPTLIESELFGHERGSFTGATADRPGAFERAQGGTLFLDELGELPLELQPKLLRVLGEREVRRVGGSKTRGIDVRIVAATNRDLRRDVNAGKFRADLYYRLAVVQVQMPPLRDRVDDIPLLVGELLNAISPGLSAPEMDIEHLMRHGWPGNVRELRNYVEQLVVLRHAPPLEVEVEADETPVLGMEKLPLHIAIERFERHYATRILKETGGNVAEAARRAGVNRATMFRIINKHGLRSR